MRCPYCKNDRDHVIDTRPSEDGHVTRRRRECLVCNRRYTTHERLEDLPLRVIKKNGQRVAFDRGSIESGITKSLEKRPVSLQQVQVVVDAVESEILESCEREIPTDTIGEIVMRKLRDLDQVAYVRFASVYREFKAVDEFVEEVKTISTRGGKRSSSERRRRSDSVKDT